MAEITVMVHEGHGTREKVVDLEEGDVIHLYQTNIYGKDVPDSACDVGVVKNTINGPYRCCVVVVEDDGLGLGDS